MPTVIEKVLDQFHFNIIGILGKGGAGETVTATWIDRGIDQVALNRNEICTSTNSTGNGVAYLLLGQNGASGLLQQEFLFVGLKRKNMARVFDKLTKLYERQVDVRERYGIAAHDDHDAPAFDGHCIINPSGDVALLAAGIAPKFWKEDPPGSGTLVEMSQAEKNVVEDPQLSQIKAQRVSEIRDRTASLLATGFEYPAASGNFFSLGGRGHSVVEVIRGGRPSFFPFAVHSVAGDTRLLLSGVLTGNLFVDAADGRFRKIHDDEDALLQRIQEAATASVARAVVDNRI